MHQGNAVSGLNEARHEEERLAALQALDVLDTEPEQRFDRITRLASILANTPIALISLVDENRQWFKSKIGLDVCETDRSIAFCNHSIQYTEPMIVPDALLDGRFKDNPLVTGEPHIRFYGGFPLILSTGEAIGTLCVIDMQPRILSAEQIQGLTDLASMIIIELEMHRRIVEVTEVAIAARKQADTLERTRNYYKSIFNACSESIATYQPMRGPDGSVRDFVMRSCNDAACKQRGLSREDMLGRTMSELVPNLSKENFDRYVRVTEDGEPDQFDDHYNDGHYDDWFRVSAARNSDGGLVLLLSVITEQKKTELDLRRSRDALDSFTAAVSHDLRTPLGHITGFIELIADDLGPRLDDQNKEFMDYVTSGVTQMRQLIDAMQKHARLGKMVIMHKPVKFDGIIKSILHRNEQEIARLNANFVLGDIAPVSGDGVLLDQLLSNLVSNALRYHHKDRTLNVEISAQYNGKGTVITVRDNGVGIPIALQNRVFELFERAAQAGDASEGLGIGLAMCRAIAKAHGGSIDIDPDWSDGACFRVFLPMGNALIVT